MNFYYVASPAFEEDKPLSITPEIKQMIEEEELSRNNEVNGTQASTVKPWEPPTMK